MCKYAHICVFHRCVYIHIYTYTCMHIHTHPHTHVYIHICLANMFASQIFTTQLIAYKRSKNKKYKRDIKNKIKYKMNNKVKKTIVKKENTWFQSFLIIVLYLFLFACQFVSLFGIILFSFFSKLLSL